LPLTILVKLLGDVMSKATREAAARLRFRQLRLIFLRLNKRQVSENASIYIPSPEFRVSRVYEPKVRSALMAPENETSLVAEIPCFSGSDLSAIPDQVLAARVIDELNLIGLIGRQHVLEWRHHLLPFAYPVYSIDYAREVATITDGLASLANLDTIGRAGNFFYSHLHDQLRLSKEYVDVLAHSKRSLALRSGSEEMDAANLNPRRDRSRSA
jgi:protoporphyrinogen oxidase